MRVLRVGLVASLLCLLPSVARAEDRAAPVETEPHWYGWQPLVADASALTLTWAAVRATGDAGVPVFTSYFIAAPVVHLAHKQWGAAAGSLALRLIVPITTAVILQRDCSDYEGCELQSAATGFMVGMGVASLIDAFALSWEPKPTRSRSSALVPTAAVSKTGVTFGLTGVF